MTITDTTLQTLTRDTIHETANAAWEEMRNRSFQLALDMQHAQLEKIPAWIKEHLAEFDAAYAEWRRANDAALAMYEGVRV